MDDQPSMPLARGAFPLPPGNVPSSSSIAPTGPSLGSLSDKNAFKSWKVRQGKRTSEPTVWEVLPKSWDYDGVIGTWNKVVGQHESSHINNIYSLVYEEHVPLILCDCRWGDRVTIHITWVTKSISHHRSGFSFVYTYPFTLGFEPSIDPLIVEFCLHFNICLG